MAESDSFSIQGYLWKFKKSLTGGSWKKNWVYADDKIIAQYGGQHKPVQSEVPKYSWKIGSCEVRPSNIRRFAFEVINLNSFDRSESAIFAADDGTSYQQWMRVLSDYKAAAREEPVEVIIPPEREMSDLDLSANEEEKKSISSPNRVEIITKEFYKKQKPRKVLLLDLFELVHLIDKKLFPHRVLAFLAEEMKKSYDSVVTAKEFLATWQQYAYLLTPSAEEIHQYYLKDRQDTLFSANIASVDQQLPFSEWNLLLSLVPAMHEVKLHPLYFRIHIPTTSSPFSHYEDRGRAVLMQLSRFYSSFASNNSSVGGSEDLSHCCHCWYELQFELLQRLEAIQKKIHDFYSSGFYDNLEKKRALFEGVIKRNGKEASPEDPQLDEDNRSELSAITKESVLEDGSGAKLREMDEELLTTLSALSLLWAQFYSQAMAGTKRMVEEFTLPDRLKSMKAIAASGSRNSSAEDQTVLELHGLHFQMLHALNRLNPASSNDQSLGTTFFEQENAILQQECFFHKFSQRQLSSLDYLNTTLHKIILMERLKSKYFEAPENEQEGPLLQQYGKCFVHKFSAVIDYRGFRVVAYAPNHSVSSETGIATSISDHPFLLQRLEQELHLKLPDQDFVKLEAITLRPSESPQLSTARSPMTVYYLSCGSLLPSDLTLVSSSEVFQKSLRPELLRAYSLAASIAYDTPLEQIQMITTQELVESDRQLRLEAEPTEEKRGEVEEEKSSTGKSHPRDSHPSFVAAETLLVPSSPFLRWKEACRFLYQDRIPQFVQWLDGFDLLPFDSASLSQSMHRHGLNMRHLGICYSLSRNVIAKQLLLAEILARSVKTLYQLQIKSYVYRQKHLSLVAERRNKSTVHDFEELADLSLVAQQEVLVEVLNLLFPTTVRLVPHGPAIGLTSVVGGAGGGTGETLLAFQQSHRKQQILHFFEFLLEIVHSKFGLQLTVSSSYSRTTPVSGSKSSAAASEPSVSDDSPAPPLSSPLIEEHPLGHYFLHCFQLLTAVSYHLQIRLKEAVFQIPEGATNGLQSIAAIAGATSLSSSQHSCIFLSSSLFQKVRDFNQLDLIDAKVVVVKAWMGQSHRLETGGVGDGRMTPISSFDEYSYFFSALLPYAHQRQRCFSRASQTKDDIRNCFDDKLGKEVAAMVGWNRLTITSPLSESLANEVPNNLRFYDQFLQEVYIIAWNYFCQGLYTEAYKWIEEKFLFRSTFLHEYSIRNLPLYCLLMIVQYGHFSSYSQAMINYDLCYEIVSKILPYSHPLQTIPMTILSDLYLSYPSCNSDGDEAKDRHSLSEVRSESIEYAKFFYQLALSVWKYAGNLETSSPNGTYRGGEAMRHDSSAMFSSSASLVSTSEAAIAAKGPHIKSTPLLPVLVLQYKLAVLYIEQGETHQAIPLLLANVQVLETTLNSLLHQNFEFSPSRTFNNDTAGGEGSSLSPPKRAGQLQATLVVLHLFIPYLYQLAQSYFSLRQFDQALIAYQKCYQLFNKVIFNDAFSARGPEDPDPARHAPSPFQSLMTQSLYEILLSSLLSIYDIYLMRNESELALEILTLIYQVFISRAYQSFLPLVSSFPFYQRILWKIFCKMNELTIITLPMNIQTLLDSVSSEWSELMAVQVSQSSGAQANITATIPSVAAADLVKQRKNNQKLFVMACKVIVEIMFRGEMVDYIVQLLQIIQKQIQEDNSLRYQYHNSGAAAAGMLEFNPHLEVMQLVKSIPTYAQAAALTLLLKDPKQFAKYII